MSDDVQNVEAHIIDGSGYRDLTCTKSGKRFSKTLLIDGIVLILVGLFCTVWPSLSLEVVSWLIGASFIFAGVTSLVGFFVTGGFAVYLGWVLVEAIIDLFIGSVFIAHPLATGAALGWLIGVGILVAGLCIVVNGIAFLRVNRGASLLLLAVGICTGALGVVLTMHPVFILRCISVFAIIFGILLTVLSFKSARALDELYR